MILIDTPLRPAATRWAAALLIMNGGVFLVPLTALSVFGLLTRVMPSILTTTLVLAVLGASLLLAARAAWRGAHWPRQYALVVVAGELLGLVIGYTYLGAALLFVGPATWLLWRRSARKFAVASEVPISIRHSPKA